MPEPQRILRTLSPRNADVGNQAINHPDLSKLLSYLCLKQTQEELRLAGSALAQVEVLAETEAAKGLVLGNSSVLRTSGRDRWLALRARLCRSCYYRAVVYALDTNEGKVHPETRVLSFGCAGCNATLTRARGEWHSPQHPDFYPPGLQCFITILAPVGYRILLRVPFLELPPLNSPRCEHDSLEIGPLAGRGAKSVVLCGSRRNLTYLSLNEKLSIAFRSDPLLEAEGWTAKYEFVRLCRNETYGESSGRICYPAGKSSSLLYSAPGDCHFTLAMPLGYQVQLSFSALQLSAARGSSSCGDSFIEVSSGALEHRFCGNWTGSPELAALHSEGNIMTIRVHMEDVRLASAASLGFCASYNAVLVNQSLAEDCHFGWVSWGLHCYKVFNESLSWAKANDVCVVQGGQLASVTTEDVQSLLDAMLFARSRRRHKTRVAEPRRLAAMRGAANLFDLGRRRRGGEPSAGPLVEQRRAFFQSRMSAAARLDPSREPGKALFLP
ncbi:hypothetical protein HPB48_015601 [Haemaphysalis longicornis]|uniref:CUB domain-containing protein n=1 Tax=Haemaphysalis longicornis TaxID=44386 RepID=A0A9J6FHJ3_HAELO|nr:hypothetical protein HPB48_015601 [Haemaphysalis longicornis]